MFVPATSLNVRKHGAASDKSLVSVVVVVCLCDGWLLLCLFDR